MHGQVLAARSPIVIVARSDAVPATVADFTVFEPIGAWPSRRRTLATFQPDPDDEGPDVLPAPSDDVPSVYQQPTTDMADGRTCEHCGAPLPQRARRDARFCTPACRARAHRSRRGGGTG